MTLKRCIRFQCPYPASPAIMGPSGAGWFGGCAAHWHLEVTPAVLPPSPLTPPPRRDLKRVAKVAETGVASKHWVHGAFSQKPTTPRVSKVARAQRTQLNDQGTCVVSTSARWARA